MRKSIKIDSVSKLRDGEAILDNLSLEIPSGKFFALLGPSGCGKTTLLRLIAGLERQDSGRIFLGGNDITDIPVNERKINTVFQSYALFPNLNVFENVAYSLRIKGLAEAEINRRVKRFLKIVNLEKQINKSIKLLSGGQQQRVALARAIINEPDVLLLDEPLAALDQKLREKMLVELIELQEELDMTFIYVTHDQGEALTVADRMVIMNYDGEIEQIGTPQDIYENPKSSFVANFVGQTNLFRGQISEDRLKLSVPELGDVFVSAESASKMNKDALLSVRPEKILIEKDSVSGYDNHLIGTVESVIYHGRSTQYNIRLANEQKVQVFEQNEERTTKQEIDYEDKVNLYWNKNHSVLLPR